MLVIDPDICIDCGVCVGECPVGAIVTDNTEEGQKWLGLNRQFSKIWPNIQLQKNSLPTAGEHIGEPDKYDRHFKSGE
jgi:ferredoxin